MGAFQRQQRKGGLPCLFLFLRYQTWVGGIGFSWFAQPTRVRIYVYSFTFISCFGHPEEKKKLFVLLLFLNTLNLTKRQAVIVWFRIEHLRIYTVYSTVHSKKNETSQLTRDQQLYSQSLTVGMKSAMAQGCRKGPPSQYSTQAGGPVRQPNTVASVIPKSGTKNWASVIQEQVLEF